MARTKAEAEVLEKKNPLSMPVKYEDARDVVAMTVPSESVERRTLTTPLMPSCVVVEYVAKRCVVENAVEEAYGNCEAALVDEEKKTPCVSMELEVETVVVP